MTRKKVEPLPDIDFNIRPVNTLVGYATQEEVAAATSYGSLFNIDIEQQIVEAARGLTRSALQIQAASDTPPGVMAAATGRARQIVRNWTRC